THAHIHPVVRPAKSAALLKVSFLRTRTRYAWARDSAQNQETPLVCPRCCPTYERCAAAVPSHPAASWLLCCALLHRFHSTPPYVPSYSSVEYYCFLFYSRLLIDHCMDTQTVLIVLQNAICYGYFDWAFISRSFYYLRTDHLLCYSAQQHSCNSLTTLYHYAYPLRYMLMRSVLAL
ncbi:hypothetical protein Tcan_00780, partial [Toxocara canis]